MELRRIKEEEDECQGKLKKNVKEGGLYLQEGKEMKRWGNTDNVE